MTACNYVPTTAGRVRAVCECCGRRSRPVKPGEDGEPCMFDLGRGWSSAPYPPRFAHADGSIGSTFHCPACNARLRAGEALKLRNYGAAAK